MLSRLCVYDLPGWLSICGQSRWMHVQNKTEGESKQQLDVFQRSTGRWRTVNVRTSGRHWTWVTRKTVVTTSWPAWSRSVGPRIRPSDPTYTPSSPSLGKSTSTLVTLALFLNLIDGVGLYGQCISKVFLTQGGENLTICRCHVSQINSAKNINLFNWISWDNSDWTELPLHLMVAGDFRTQICSMRVECCNHCYQPIQRLYWWIRKQWRYHVIVQFAVLFNVSTTVFTTNAVTMLKTVYTISINFLNVSEKTFQRGLQSPYRYWCQTG